MKKIISAIVLIAMLLSMSLSAIPANAADNTATVTDKAGLYRAMRAAKGNYTINISGSITLDTAMPECDKDAHITLAGGTLVLSKLSTFYVHGNISIDADNLTLRSGGVIYANGYDFAIEDGVSVSYVDGEGAAVADASVSFTVYGGANGSDIDGDTNITILSGIYTYIYGGSNGGTISGSTHVTIGTGSSSVNNNTLVGWDDEDHSANREFYGGSKGGGIILGDTHLNVGSNGYADYVVAGNNGGGKIGGTAYLDFCGYAYGLYGASRGGNTMNDVCLTMTGGGVCDIFGGSAAYMLGSDEDKSNVVVKIFGGEITRRVYGGCYNNYDGGWKSNTYVVGTVTLIIGGSPNFSYRLSDNDRGLFACSRQDNAAAAEKKNIIFLDGKTYTVGRDSGDLAGSITLGSMFNPSTKHQFTYSASGNTITESCSCGCGHSASTTLTLTSSEHLYTGAPIECGVITQGNTWMSGPVSGVNYQNNIYEGNATASMTLEMTSDYTVSQNFTIFKPEPPAQVEKPDTSIEGKDPDGDGNIDYTYSADVDVNYTVENTYTLIIPPTIALGDLNAEIPVSVGVEDMVIPTEHILHMAVTSKNGFKLKDEDIYLAYSMKYGDVTVTEGTEENEILALRWDALDNRGEIDLGFTRLQDPPDEKAREYTDILSFSAEVEATGNLPLVDGKAFDTAEYDQGQGSKLYVAEGITSINSFKTYLQFLDEAGYEFYTSNVIGDNHFATFTGYGKIVNVMYTPHYEEIRVVTDLESEFALPGLEAENVYKEWADYEPSLTLVSNYQMGWPGRMGYVFQLADGSFLVIDGGYSAGKNASENLATSPNVTYGGSSSAPYLIELLEEFAPDKNNIVIAAWFITHMHEDHFGAFVDLSNIATYSTAKSHITIEKMIYNQSSMDDVRKTDDYKSDSYTENEALSVLFNYAMDQWGDSIQQRVKAHPGQKFFLRNLTLTIYTSQDLLHASDHYDPWLTGSNADGSNTKYINNTSCVSMIEFSGKKMLFLADSSATNNPYVVKPLYGNTLHEINVVQVAHHGYSDTAVQSVYECLGENLELVLWPSNAEHFYGRDIGYTEKGVYYGGTSDCGCNVPLFREGVKHYIHGKCNLTIKDFVNYTPVEVLDELQIYDKNTWVPNLNYMTENNYPS